MGFVVQGLTVDFKMTVFLDEVEQGVQGSCALVEDGFGLLARWVQDDGWVTLDGDAGDVVFGVVDLGNQDVGGGVGVGVGEF